jgi:Protein of unknown function (DUF2817)
VHEVPRMSIFWNFFFAAVIVATFCQYVFRIDIAIESEEYYDGDRSHCKQHHADPFQEGECFFREDYNSARRLFLESAKAIGAEISFLPVYDKLGTDVAVVRGSDRLFVLHVSGVHGVEGFAGSSVQSAALQHLATIPPEQRADFPTAVFVHALNPYGFANNRRVNEENVDLNRNFLTDDEFAFVLDRDPNYAGYVDLDNTGLMNPTSQPFSSRYTLLNDAYSMGRMLYAVIRYGLLHLKRALVSGNYHKADGLGYGGTELAKSSLNLITLVQEIGIPDGADQVVMVDVHTGLGPKGIVPDGVLFVSIITFRAGCTPLLPVR